MRFHTATPQANFAAKVSDFLARRLNAASIPDLTLDSIQVNPLDASGATAVFFAVSSTSEKELFLKLRSQFDQIAQESFTKQRRLLNLLHQGAIPVSRIVHLETISPDDLPESVKSLELLGKKIKPREIPHVLILQEFSEGEVACKSIADNQRQKSLIANLGRTVFQIHSLDLSGTSIEEMLPNWQTRYGYEAVMQKAEALKQAGILLPDDLNRLEEALLPIKSVDGPLVIAHSDLQPDNFSVMANEQIASIYDWDNARLAPWQFDIARVLLTIEAPLYGVPRAVVAERKEAFLSAYQEQGKIFTAHDDGLIKAFQLAACIVVMESLYLKQEIFSFEPDKFQELTNGAYKRTVEPDQRDFLQFLLGHELVLRSLIA